MQGDDLRNTDKNREMGGEARKALQDLLIRGCRRGWYGKLELTIEIKDGTIQVIREGQERLRR